MLKQPRYKWHSATFLDKQEKELSYRGFRTYEFQNDGQEESDFTNDNELHCHILVIYPATKTVSSPNVWCLASKCLPSTGLVLLKESKVKPLPTDSGLSSNCLPSWLGDLEDDSRCPLDSVYQRYNSYRRKTFFIRELEASRPNKPRSLDTQSR